MRFCDRGEEMFAFEEHGHEDRVVSGVGSTFVRIVVEVGIAFFEIGMAFAQCCCLQLRAENVDRKPLCTSEQLVVSSCYGAREVARTVDHC